MLIYASLALNIYIQLMSYTYRKRDQFEGEQKELKERGSVENSKVSETPASGESKKDK